MNITRLVDGGWRMENMWVEMTAELDPGGSYMRGIQPGVLPHQA